MCLLVLKLAFAPRHHREVRELSDLAMIEQTEEAGRTGPPLASTPGLSPVLIVPVRWPVSFVATLLPGLVDAASVSSSLCWSRLGYCHQLLVPASTGVFVVVRVRVAIEFEHWARQIVELESGRECLHLLRTRRVEGPRLNAQRAHERTAAAAPAHVHDDRGDGLRLRGHTHREYVLECSVES